MLQTYKAVLTGTRLEWTGPPPEHFEQPVDVFVTILREVPNSPSAQGHKMVEALEKLARIQALPEISDPPAWQHQQRRERPLPGRDE